VGHHFPWRQSLWWVVQDGSKTRYQKSNGQINVVVCAEKACNFKVWAHQKKGEGHNRQSKPHSLYQYAGQQARGAEPPSISPQAVPKVLTVHKTTTTSEHHYAQTSTYMPQITYLLVLAAALQLEQVANYHSRKLDHSR